MWSLESISFRNFDPQPSLKASLKEFIQDLQRVAPFHSGFSAKIEKTPGNQYKIQLVLECGTYIINEKAQSESLYELIYYAFQAAYAKILEHENSKVQALNFNQLKDYKRQVS